MPRTALRVCTGNSRPYVILAVRSRRAGIQRHALIIGANESKSVAYLARIRFRTARQPAAIGAAAGGHRRAHAGGRQEYPDEKGNQTCPSEFLCPRSYIKGHGACEEAESELLGSSRHVKPSLPNWYAASGRVDGLLRNWASAGEPSKFTGPTSSSEPVPVR
jgi:hypothetical protein